MKGPASAAGLQDFIAGDLLGLPRVAPLELANLVGVHRPMSFVDAFGRKLMRGTSEWVPVDRVHGTRLQLYNLHAAPHGLQCM